MISNQNIDHPEQPTGETQEAIESAPKSKKRSKDVLQKSLLARRGIEDYFEKKYLQSRLEDYDQWFTDQHDTSRVW